MNSEQGERSNLDESVHVDVLDRHSVAIDGLQVRRKHGLSHLAGRKPEIKRRMTIKTYRSVDVLLLLLLLFHRVLKKKVK